MLTKEQITKFYPQWIDIEYIGGGGYSKVFKIKDEFAFNEMEKTCAIKVLNIRNQEDAARILRTAKREGEIHYATMNSLEEKGLGGIVKIFGGHIIDNHPVIRMEYLPRGSLFDNIDKLSFSQRLQIYRQTCRIINHLHKNGVFHGDIKSQNILLDNQYNPKVGDFGLSDNQKIFNTMKIQGTPIYTAPELFLGKRNKKQEPDVYALGVLGFELFTKKSPEEIAISRDDHKLKDYEKSLAQNRRILEFINNSKLEEGIKGILAQALEPNFRKRTITANDIFAAILKNESPCYLTTLGKQTLDEIKVCYKGPCPKPPIKGKRVYLSKVLSDDRAIEVIGFVEIGEIVNNGNNYNFIPKNNQIHELKKKVRISIEQAALFDLKTVWKKFDHPASKLKLLKSISYDAEKFIQDNSK